MLGVASPADGFTSTRLTYDPPVTVLAHALYEMACGFEADGEPLFLALVDDGDRVAWDALFKAHKATVVCSSSEAHVGGGRGADGRVVTDRATF